MEKSEVIEILLDLNHSLKVSHMADDMWGDTTKEDREIYQKRFAAINIAIKEMEKKI